MNSIEPGLLPFDAAIVDLDGTLIDTLGDFHASLDAALADLSLPPVDRGFIARTVGKGSEHLVSRVLAQVQAPPDRFDEAFARYQHHYQRINGQHAVVYAGVVEGLQVLQRAGLRLACVTNKPLAPAEALLKAKGLRHFFEVCFGGDSFERKKPDPLPVVRACEALRTSPARTLVIGDSANDALAARGAGCRVVLLAHGYNHGEPVHAVDCDAVIDRMDQLVDAWQGRSGAALTPPDGPAGSP